MYTYNFWRASFIIEEFSKKGNLKKAELGLKGDWTDTATTVWEDGVFIVLLNDDTQINGQYYQQPQIKTSGDVKYTHPILKLTFDDNTEKEFGISKEVKIKYKPIFG